MNGLLADAAVGQSVRDELKWQIRVQLRRIFVLIDEFHVLVKFDSQRQRLHVLVQDVVAATKGCFAVAELLHSERDSVSAEHARCLADLEDFLQSMGSGQAKSMLEITHALDDLLVQCLMLDVEEREARP